MSAHDKTPASLLIKGLWQQNPALVSLLGLCPLLVVSASVVTALGLGLATLLVMVGTATAVALVRSTLSDAIRLPVLLVMLAAFATTVALLMQAFAYELHQVLGIFVPLMAVNGVILTRAEAFASHNPPALAAADALAVGSGYLAVLLVMGALRELLGSGTLFADMHWIFGEAARGWQLSVFGEDYPDFALALLPPGAFLMLGVLVALKNRIDSHRQAHHATPAAPIRKGAKRVRTTGHIV